MAAAGGEGLARTPLLPASAALALLGVLVYLGALCAACRRYALPTAPLLSLLALRTELGAPWWHAVAARGDPTCACPELGPLGSAALLTLNPQPQPQCNSAWPDPAPLCLAAPRRTPCAQRSRYQLGMGDVALQEQPGES